ncbi:hypothetical protein [Microbacterium lacticum]|uniref:hypothetical protein n=1 Tax=Microbacterium lacticum TaxID=33885 RepID=UPI001F55CFDE|nr:hypothetical protein [Microbacterium lacticum]
MDERFSMTVDQLLDGIRDQAFIARRSKGAKRRAAFVRILDLASTARDYVVLGFPEPANHSADLVQGDAKLRGNSGDADANQDHTNGRSM